MPAFSGEAIAAAVRQVLSVRGPMTEDDLLGVLDADGIDLGPDPDGNCGHPGRGEAV